MGESRHNPNQLLKAIQADEENRNKGHLKIFFGYAAGVGNLRHVRSSSYGKTAGN